MFKILVFTCLLAFSASAVDICDDISNAIRSGDAKQLANYFGNNIDLTLTNQEDVYAKDQGESLLRDFFSKNPPKTFALNHRGASKEGILFAIGTLASTNGKNFRVSFTLKSVQGKHILQELRIETQ